MGDIIGDCGAFSLESGGAPEEVADAMANITLEGLSAVTTANSFRKAQEAGDQPDPSEYRVVLGGVEFQPVTE